MHSPMTNMLAKGVTTVLTKPTMGGINAPPEIAITSSPDISLARLGILSSASEKITGNILPAPSPIRKINNKATIYPGESNTPAIPANAIKDISNRKERGLIQFNRIAPISRAIISPAKKMLIPIAPLSNVIPNFTIKMLAMLVLIATSAPTIKKIESVMKKMKRFFSKLKQDLKVAGSRSGFDSCMGVLPSQTATTIDVTPYTAKISFQSPKRVARKVVIKGPANDMIALMNCPVLNRLDNFSGGDTSCNRGLVDTWINVFPTPSIKNATNIIGNE